MSYGGNARNVPSVSYERSRMSPIDDAIGVGYKPAGGKPVSATAPVVGKCETSNDRKASARTRNTETG
jgi:hypothetical protein